MVSIQVQNMSVGIFWILALLLILGTWTEAFLVKTQCSSARYSITMSTTSLFYTNYTQHVDQTAASPQQQSSKLEIPVIGPLLNVPKPLIIGESMWLNPPTPLQWKTIETCVEAQKRSFEEQSSTTTATPSTTLSDSHNNNLFHNLATIDQSPLVAVLHKDGKNFATIAAIVGIVTEQGSIDTTSAESFRESLAMLHSPYYSDHSRVRLVGIGRARLTRFVVQNNGNAVDEDNGAVPDENEEEEDTIMMQEPLLMAQMELLLDSNENGKASSPVHALNQLSMLASRIRFLHQDRQKIVRGLQAAQARLEMAMEEWKDYDGIGALYERRDINGLSTNEASEQIPPIYNENLQMTLHSFLREFNLDTNDSDPMASSRPLSPEAARCMQLNNFGLGTSPTAYADLIPMSEVLVERLQPFYSPQRSNTEEFSYEAFSWVALESLKLYLPPETVAQAMQSSNTCERLEFLYHAMMNHKRDLTELAKAKSQELLDCGEECSGLF
jgi:hypothetical protein